MKHSNNHAAAANAAKQTNRNLRKLRAALAAKLMPYAPNEKPQIYYEVYSGSAPCWVNR